jgi:DNA polymerase III subunit beta
MFIEKIDRDVFLKPLQTVIGIVERKQPLPILSNVLIEKTNTELRFIATDLEIQIETHIDNSDHTGTDGAITVAAKKLQEILRVLPEESKINLKTVDHRLQVNANKSRFNLQTLPSQDFPKIAEPANFLEKIEIEQGKLKQLFSMVQYAMAQQDIRYYLNGVLLSIEENVLRLVATDGHRLAFASTSLKDKYSKQEVILPRKIINELVKLLEDTEEKITILFSENQIKAVFSKITIISKIIDGKFPDYERVIPDHINHLALDRVMILQALQRAAILSNEKFRGVRFILTEKNLRIVSNNSEQEEAQEDIEVDYHGVALDIGFNVNYLLDGLNSTSEQMVTLSFGDPNSSVLMTIPGNDNFKYVVMPMRI